MKNSLLTLLSAVTTLLVIACTNETGQRGAVYSDTRIDNGNGTTQSKSTSAVTRTAIENEQPSPGAPSMTRSRAGSIGGSTVTHNRVYPTDSAMDADTDQSHLKPMADHSITVGNTSDGSAFNRPAGNSLGSAMNGDANNPKNTVVAQAEPNTVSTVILQQMLNKDDEYNSRLATLREHEVNLSPAQRKSVDQNLKEANQNKQDFDKLLSQLRDDTDNNHLKNQVNVASAKLDRCLRKIEQKIK